MSARIHECITNAKTALRPRQCEKGRSNGHLARSFAPSCFDYALLQELKAQKAQPDRRSSPKRQKMDDDALQTQRSDWWYCKSSKSPTSRSWEFVLRQLCLCALGWNLDCPECKYHEAPPGTTKQTAPVRVIRCPGIALDGAVCEAKPGFGDCSLCRAHVEYWETLPSSPVTLPPSQVAEIYQVDRVLYDYGITLVPPEDLQRYVNDLRETVCDTAPPDYTLSNGSLNGVVHTLIAPHFGLRFQSVLPCPIPLLCVRFAKPKENLRTGLIQLLVLRFDRYNTVKVIDQQAEQCEEIHILSRLYSDVKVCGSDERNVPRVAIHLDDVDAAGRALLVFHGSGALTDQGLLFKLAAGCGWYRASCEY
ncbi:unnamed protein product [Durusdinium trenchii]|uniref:Uncharacterized protein n=1 Tax=Durusdinium trenchii TaxID=1381693 RepID=A0ABP0KMQ0_9DINO